MSAETARADALQPVRDLARRGRWRAARRTVLALLEEHPEDPEIRAAEIAIRATLQPARREEAQEELRILIAQAPELVEPRRRYATIAWDRGFREQAVDWMLELERVHPDDREVKAVAASMLFNLGRAEEAWQRYAALLNKKPMGGSSWLIVAAHVAAIGAGDSEGARRVRDMTSRIQRIGLVIMAHRWALGNIWTSLVAIALGGGVRWAMIIAAGLGLIISAGDMAAVSGFLRQKVTLGLVAVGAPALGLIDSVFAPFDEPVAIVIGVAVGIAMFVLDIRRRRLRSSGGGLPSAP